MNSYSILSSLPDTSGKSLLRELRFGYMLSPMMTYTSCIILQAISARVIVVAYLFEALVVEEIVVVTSVASPFGGQKPEPEVAEPGLPVVEVAQSPSACGAVAGHHPRRVRWVDHEAGVVAQKARVAEVIVSSSPPPVLPGCPVVSPVALVASGEGSRDRHAMDPGFVTISSRRQRKGRGGRH